MRSQARSLTLGARIGAPTVREGSSTVGDVAAARSFGHMAELKRKGRGENTLPALDVGGSPGMNVTDRNKIVVEKKLLRNTLAIAALTVAPAVAQQLSFGIIGGASATSGFPNRTIASAAAGTAGTVFTTYSSGAGDYLVGAMIEASLPAQLAIEADGIYRPANFRSFSSSIEEAKTSSLSNTVLMWEFPVLLKTRFSKVPILPHAGAYAEVGPSFRIASNRNDTRPSNHGVTAGLGIATSLGRLTVSPALRYTRWAADPASSIPFVPPASQNQFEVVVGLAMRSSRPHK